MTAYEIISLIISSLTLIATVTISFLIYYLEKARERKKITEINNEIAKNFIIDHDSEIAFIPLCLVASCKNRHRKHYRNIYNDFNKLSNDVQKEVLKQLNYDCDIILDNEWVNEGIRIISKFISDNKLSNVGDFLYDEAKYFHSAFEYYAEEEYSHNDTYLQNYKDEFGLGKFLCSTDGSKKGFLSFRNYFQAYMDKVTIQKDFEAIPPIAYLINVEDFYSCDKKNLCYWIMEMLSVISAYIINTTNKKWILCKGDASPETFEDRYYDVLINLFNLSKSKKSKDF